LTLTLTVWRGRVRVPLADRLGGREQPPPLHAQVCRAADAANARGGESAARQTVRRFFDERVMLTDGSEVEAQLRAGVCERVRGPSRLLAAVPRST
jgi:hypothetical protein